MSRNLAADVAVGALLAHADPALSGVDLAVLAVIAGWPHLDDLDECIRAGDITLDGLCARIALARPYVFAAVARLEDYHYLPRGAIR